METVKERVQKVLQREFSPKEIILQSAGGGMVGGWIISKSFEELDEVERQQKVWQLFDTFLAEKDRNRIVGFLTFTPLEKKMAFDESETTARRSSISMRKNTAVQNGRVGQKRRLAAHATMR